MNRDFYWGVEFVANIRSAIKRARQAEKRRLRNRSVKSLMRTRARRFYEALESGGDAAEALRKAISAIDKALKKGVVHKNTAARRKSRLMKAFAQAQASK